MLIMEVVTLPASFPSFDKHKRVMLSSYRLLIITIASTLLVSISSFHFHPLSKSKVHGICASASSCLYSALPSPSHHHLQPSPPIQSLKAFSSYIKTFLRRSEKTLKTSFSALLLVICFFFFQRPALAASGGRLAGSSSSSSSSSYKDNSRRNERRRDSWPHKSSSSPQYNHFLHPSRPAYSSSNTFILSTSKSYLLMLVFLLATVSKPSMTLLSRLSKTSSFLETQLVYYLTKEELSDMINSLSAISSRYTSSSSQLASVVEDICVLALRKEELLVGAYILHEKWHNGDESFESKAREKMLDVSISERSKFDKQTSSNVDGKRVIIASSSEVKKEKQDFKTYFILTLLLSSKGEQLMLKDSSSTSNPLTSRGNFFSLFKRKEKGSLLKQSANGRSVSLSRESINVLLRSIPSFLQRLRSDPDSAFAVDILWTPDQVKFY